MHLLCFLGDSFQIREMIQENGKHHPKLCSFCPFFWGQVRWSYHEFKKIRSTHWMGLVYFTYKPPELPSLGVVDMWTQQKKTSNPQPEFSRTGESLKKFQCSTIAAGNCRKMKHFKKRIIQDLVGSVVIGSPPLISAMGFGHLEGVVKHPRLGTRTNHGY